MLFPTCSLFEVFGFQGAFGFFFGGFWPKQLTGIFVENLCAWKLLKNMNNNDCFNWNSIGWFQIFVLELDIEPNIHKNLLLGVPGMNLCSSIDNLGCTLVNMATENEISIAMLVYGRGQLSKRNSGEWTVWWRVFAWILHIICCCFMTMKEHIYSHDLHVTVLACKDTAPHLHIFTTSNNYTTLECSHTQQLQQVKS